MMPEQWQQVEGLFHAALQHDPRQRAQFLADACAGDVLLQHEVESLLAAHASAGSFIEAPVFVGTEAWLADASAQAIVGRQIGPYKTVRQLGVGGMGVVYLAVRADDHYHQQVAIKLIKPGLPSSDLLRRFRTERQILASLDHPNIAKLLDGGTTADGLPYLVMDYVEGLPLDVYCDRYALSIPSRLTLFRTICAAVHYAHQHLVVHRDLKPGNILVTADGVPKLLDFGIAKLLHPALMTQTSVTMVPGQQGMTLAYASPEQLRGEPITTVSDVYSLGVVLYELLTGHHPYRFTSHLPHDMARVICEVEPQKPSTAMRQTGKEPGTHGGSRRTPAGGRQPQTGQLATLRRLAGDLDTIVLMALRKAPSQRYASVEQLSEDLRRYLEGLPVLARPQTLGYRSAKFIRRHKAGVLAAVLLGVTLIGGIVSTTWQARVAETQRARAERRFNDIRQLATSFLFEFHAAIEKLPGSTPARELLVKRALEYLASLAQEAGDNASLQRELAAAYEKVGILQWQRYYAHLGNTAGARESQHKALAIREALAAADPTNAPLRRELAHSYLLVGDVFVAGGDLSGALAQYRQSLETLKALAASGPTDAPLRRDLAIRYQRIGDTLGNPRFPNLGDPQGALENYRKMQEIFERLVQADPKDGSARHSLSIGYEKIGDMLPLLGDPAGALHNYWAAREIRQELAAADPTNASLRRDLAVAHRKVGLVLAATGDQASALQSYQAALELRQELAAVDPQNATARTDLARIYGDIGQALAALGELAGSMENFGAALAIFSDLAARDSTNMERRTDVSRTLTRLAALSMQAGQLEKARGYTRHVLALQKEYADRASATAADLHAYARTLLTCEPPDLQDPTVALHYAQRAITLSPRQDVTFLGTLAFAYHRTGDHARALATVEQALALPLGDAAQRQELEASRAQFSAALKHP